MWRPQHSSGFSKQLKQRLSVNFPIMRKCRMAKHLVLLWFIDLFCYSLVEDCCSGVENKNKDLKLKDPSCSAWVCCFVASEASIRKSEECGESWLGILISKVFDFSRGRESQILTNFSLNKSCQNRSRRPEFSPSSQWNSNAFSDQTALLPVAQTTEAAQKVKVSLHWAFATVTLRQ